jgi:hypothetical protein
MGVLRTTPLPVSGADLLCDDVSDVKDGSKGDQVWGSYRLSSMKAMNSLKPIQFLDTRVLVDGSNS